MQHLGEINGVRVGITEHALKRMCEMEMSAEDFKMIISDPEDTAESKKYKGQRNYKRGDFALGTVMENGILVIVTAVFATRAAWLRASLDGRLGEGRSYRDTITIPTF